MSKEKRHLVERLLGPTTYALSRYHYEKPDERAKVVTDVLEDAKPAKRNILTGVLSLAAAVAAELLVGPELAAVPIAGGIAVSRVVGYRVTHEIDSNLAQQGIEPTN